MLGGGGRVIGAQAVLNHSVNCSNHPDHCNPIHPNHPSHPSTLTIPTLLLFRVPEERQPHLSHMPLSAAANSSSKPNHPTTPTILLF